MKSKALFIFSIASVSLLTACPSGGPQYRLTINHSFCGSDTEKLEKLTENDALEFFNLIAPIADMDRAALQAPRPDDTKIKRPEVQEKIVTDLRERCLFDLEELENRGVDYENQTFKYKNKKSKDGKKAGVACPIIITEEVIPDKTVPALVSAPTAARSLKSHARANWKKADAEYKLLGAIVNLDLSGLAETIWYKPSNPDDVNPGKQNIILDVNEKYDVVANLKDGKALTGEYRACRALQEDHDIKTKSANVRYDASIVRILLNLPKGKSEAKFINVMKLTFDANLQKWVTDRSVRNDFYINGWQLTTDEVATYEKKRRDSISFGK